MKIEWHSKLTRLLLFIALLLHVGMIVRALLIMGNLQSINDHFSTKHVEFTKLLALTNSVRRAEESVRECSLRPSVQSRAAFCRDLAAADRAAAEAERAGALTQEFSAADLVQLRRVLGTNSARCADPSRAVPGPEAALAAFISFYDTASALRRKLSAHIRTQLDINLGLAAAAKQQTMELVLSSSSLATVVLLLMGWVVYSLRTLNRAVIEQRDEILVLKSGIEENPLGVVLTDTAGVIRYVNRAFTAMHGYEAAEAVGKNPRILKSGEMPQALYESLWRTLLSGRSWSGELHNKTKSGALVWVRANISPIRDTGGNLTHFMALHKDVTLEKQLMAEVVTAKREADAANQAKSDFLAAMSHEIRTPLNAIVGMSELIDEGKLSGEQAQYLSIMRGASDTLLSLINNILDISKIEAGKIDMEKVPFNLEELLSGVTEMISVSAAQKGVEVSCKIDPDVPVFVEGDATRLRQVLINLMGNAVKFVEKGWVALNVRKQRSEGECLHLIFSVQDTGIGIPTDKLASVFEKFTQADSSTTRKYGGTGLGLPISKMLIELMGGKIWAESDPGVGTIFYFTISLCPQKEKTTVYLPKADIKELKGKRFLVVDDNLINRIIIREICQSWGASCEGASGGEAGLAKVLEEQRRGAPFHAVFTDFNMPGMDGHEFCRRLLTDPAVDPKPAVALVTSDSVRFKKQDFTALGVRSFILKPVKKQSVLDGALEMLAVEKTAAPVPEQKTGAPGREDLPELSVLIADDAADNRMLMSSLLKNSKVRLELAVDGRDALEKFKAGTFDIVFMDMLMPEMDGFEATGRLRELEASAGRARTRVVALTAMATREDVDKALKAGCDDYLSKPIRKAVFYSYLIKFAADRRG